MTVPLQKRKPFPKRKLKLYIGDGFRFSDNEVFYGPYGEGTNGVKQFLSTVITTVLMTPGIIYFDGVPLSARGVSVDRRVLEQPHMFTVIDGRATFQR